MKKSNPARQKLLQKKRTKRNAARKGAKYDPNKLEQRAQAALQASQTSSVSEPDGGTVFTV